MYRATTRSAIFALSRRQALIQRHNNNNNKNLFSMSSSIHTSFALRKNNDHDREQKRLKALPTMQQQYSSFHSSAPSEKGVALVLGLGALSATMFAASSAVKSYNEWKASLPSPEEVSKQQEEAAAKQKEEQAKEEPKQQQQQEGKRENIFAKWFNVGVGSKYYEGGFEETMTRKEAALILGVRESSSPQRIKEAHRKLLILNHPDTGGSTYLSGKINEAKELLLKGKRMSG